MSNLPKAMAAAFILATVLMTVRSLHSEPPAAKARPMIRASDLRGATVVGDLGKPLGTLVTVKGKYRDMTFTRRKADDGRIVLVIAEVNGEPLAKAVEFDFGHDNLLERVAPKDGEEFELIGFEAGRFWGDVPGAAKYEVPLPGVATPFDFYTDLNVLKDVKNNISEKDTYDFK